MREGKKAAELSGTMLVPHVLGASISAVGCFYIAQQALGFPSAGLALIGYWDSEFVVEVLPLRLAGLRVDGSAAPTMVCMSASVEMIEVRGLAGLKSSGRKGVLAFKESSYKHNVQGSEGSLHFHARHILASSLFFRNVCQTMAHGMVTQS